MLLIYGYENWGENSSWRLNVFLDSFHNLKISLLYISTSVWLLHTPNAGCNMLFQFFCAKNSIWSVQNPNAGRNIQHKFKITELRRISMLLSGWTIKKFLNLETNKNYLVENFISHFVLPVLVHTFSSG